MKSNVCRALGACPFPSCCVKKTTLKGLGLAAIVTMAFATSACGSTDDAQASEGNLTDSNDAWTSWVAENAKPLQTIDPSKSTKDLEPFRAMIGDAALVALGENDHAIHDYPQFRNRFFQYLVTTLGFRAIAPETGILEGKLIEDYVQGAPNVSIEHVLKEGVTHGMGAFEEMRDLVAWMREYNLGQSDPKKRIHFYGFDLPAVGDAPILPLEQLSGYLTKVDPDAHGRSLVPLLALAEKAFALTKAFREAWRAFKKDPEAELDPDHLDALSSIGFDQLTTDEQKRLENGIKDLVGLLKEREGSYVTRSSAEDYFWNAHLAEIAGQHVRNFRSRQKNHHVWAYGTVVGHLKTAGLFDGLKNIDLTRHVDEKVEDLAKKFAANSRGRESRELAAAENTRWGQQHYGRTLVFAHVGHTMKGATNVKLGPVQIDSKQLGKGQGILLKRMYDAKYVMFGTSMGDLVDDKQKHIPVLHEGTANETKVETVATCDDCIEKAFLPLGDKSPAYLLDIRAVKEPALAAIAKDRAGRWQLGFQRFNHAESYDGLVYFPRIQRGRALKL